jgi:hypothetical protein
MKASTLKLTVDTSELDVALERAKELEAVLARIAAARTWTSPYPSTWPAPYTGPYWSQVTSTANGVLFNDAADDK